MFLLHIFHNKTYLKFIAPTIKNNKNNNKLIKLAKPLFVSGSVRSIEKEEIMFFMLTHHFKQNMIIFFAMGNVMSRERK